MARIGQMRSTRLRNLPVLRPSITAGSDQRENAAPCQAHAERRSHEFSASLAHAGQTTQEIRDRRARVSSVSTFTVTPAIVLIDGPIPAHNTITKYDGAVTCISCHAKQAAVIASQCHAGAYLGRFVVVVDDDIDPSNTDDVIWAMTSRCEPEQDIDILRRCWSGPLDPRIPREEAGFSSRAIIDATRPYEWRETFPKVSGASRELKEKVARDWREFLEQKTGEK